MEVEEHHHRQPSMEEVHLRDVLILQETLDLKLAALFWELVTDSAYHVKMAALDDSLDCRLICCPPDTVKLWAARTRDCQCIRCA